MAGTIDVRLRQLGIALPEAQEPKVAKIMNWTIANGILFVSGQIPQWNGERRFIGKVGREFDLAEGQRAARTSALNVLAHARVALGGDLDRVERVIALRAYINATPEFTALSEVANGASELMMEVFGDAGRHTRTAMGLTVMPFDVAVEIEAQFLVR